MRDTGKRRLANIVSPALVVGLVVVGVVLVIWGLIHAHDYFVDAALTGDVDQKYASYRDLWWVGLALLPLVPLALEVKAALGHRYTRAAAYAAVAGCAAGVSIIVPFLLVVNQFCMNVSSVCAGKEDNFAYHLWWTAVLLFIIASLASFLCTVYFASRAKPGTGGAGRDHVPQA